MELNDGKFYVPFDSVIGLNPTKVSFTCDLTTTNYIELQHLQGDTLYEIRLDEAAIIGDYSTFTQVQLYVDEALAEWDGYYVLSNDTYYEMTKAITTQINGSNYVMYVAYVKGDTYRITSNPSYSSIFTTSEFTETAVMLTYREDGFDLCTLEEQVNQVYYHEITTKTFKVKVTAYTLGTLTWTATSEENGTFYYTDATKGQQLGTSSAPFKSLTLTSSSVSNITNIKINTSGAAGIDATLTVTVGGVQIGNPVNLTNTATVYEFASNDPLSGEVVLSYTQASNVGIYIKSFQFIERTNQSIDEYRYAYYLQSDTPGLLSTIGLVENNNVYFGF